MGIEDIQISEELETNAPSIKYRGNEGPKSPQEIEMMMTSVDDPFYRGGDEDEHSFRMFGKPYKELNADELEEFREEMMRLMNKFSKGPVLPSDEDPINPFGPKPQGPVLPDRQMAAYGGIMGLDGRKQYGIGSWFQENIMDPIKKNPLVAAAALTGGVDLYRNKEDSVIGSIFNNDAVQRVLKGKEILDKENKGTGKYEGGVYDALAKNIVPIIGGLGAGIFTKNEQGAGGGQDASTYGQVNDQTAMNIKEYTKGLNLLDEKGQMAAGQNFAVSDNARKYSPTEMLEVYQNAANGGRIGFSIGGDADNMVAPQINIPQVTAAEEKEKKAFEIIQKLQDSNLTDDVREILQQQLQLIMPQSMPEMTMPKMAMGGRIGRAEGGIMDLGGMEKDYRAEGGFVPIGREEKADDVPARLSVNEFVFTADAVRNAGGGDIDQGAQVMENMMKHLEAGGQVSEESQGMAGARDMFATSQRLGDVV